MPQAAPKRNGAARPHAATRVDRPARPAARVTRRQHAARLNWAGAVVAFVIAAAGLFAWHQPVVRTAPPGERLTVTLPDGSLVELNSGSQIFYARSFGETRAVELHGEAFFDVAEEQRPFIVETFNARIRVLGTRFGVRAWPRDPEARTTVALESGRVALASAHRPERSVELQPGQTRSVAAREIADLEAPAALTVADATAWRHGDLVFKHHPLGTVLADVSRRFAIDVRVVPDRLAQKRLNLALRQPDDAEDVVRDLALALGLQYRTTLAGFELFEGSASDLQR